MRLSLAVLVTLTLALSACGEGGLSEAEEHLDAGVALEMEGRLEEAISEFDEAIRLDPQFAPAYVDRGLTYDYLGQYQLAIQDYDEAIRLDPQFALAYVHRGLAYDNLGQYQVSERAPGRGHGANNESHS